MKKCSNCQESKDDSCFSRRTGRPRGRVSWCKECIGLGAFKDNKELFIHALDYLDKGN